MFDRVFLKVECVATELASSNNNNNKNTTDNSNNNNNNNNSNEPRSSNITFRVRSSSKTPHDDVTDGYRPITGQNETESTRVDSSGDSIKVEDGKSQISDGNAKMIPHNNDTDTNSNKNIDKISNKTDQHESTKNPINNNNSNINDEKIFNNNVNFDFFTNKPKKSINNNIQQLYNKYIVDDHNSNINNDDEKSKSIKKFTINNIETDLDMLNGVNTRSPGKLNPSLLKNMQQAGEKVARKHVPSYFQPTIMVAAQQVCDVINYQLGHVLKLDLWWLTVMEFTLSANV